MQRTLARSMPGIEACISTFAEPVCGERTKAHFPAPQVAVYVVTSDQAD